MEYTVPAEFYHRFCSFKIFGSMQICCLDTGEQAPPAKYAGKKLFTGITLCIIHA
jgi:hypothetical protein